MPQVVVIARRLLSGVPVRDRKVEEVLSHSRPYGIAEAMEAVVARIRERAEASERAEIAAEIREAIERSRLSRAEFAAAIGTSASRLSTYATGKVTPSAALMVRIRQTAARSVEKRATGLAESRKNSDADRALPVDGQHAIAGVLALSAEPEDCPPERWRQSVRFQRVRSQTWPQTEKRVGPLACGVAAQVADLYLIAGEHPITFVAVPRQAKLDTEAGTNRPFGI
jgi:transcriptional regulator with XRE-family HTH domain